MKNLKEKIINLIIYVDIIKIVQVENAKKFTNSSKEKSLKQLEKENKKMLKEK